MTEKIHVGVIFGGRSSEHEVAVRSARAVIEALDTEKYTVIPVAITKDGHWLSPANAAAMLPDETRRLLPAEATGMDEASVAIIGDPSHQGLTTIDGDGDGRLPQTLDVVFPVLHGPYGEDGTIQGLLEMAGIPYVGSGVLGSACGMDKVTMKALFVHAGLPVCKYTWFRRAEWERDRESVTQRIEQQIGYPCFVKPANLGSSVGISKATDRASLAASINLAARYDRKILVEEAVDAREIECAIIGNDEPEASLPGEYVVHDKQAEFLDYTEKYSNTGHVEFVVPAPVPEELVGQIQEMAKQAFKAVDGAGLARVDFFLQRATNELLISEINTMPGLTEVSGYPKLWAGTGLAFPQVVERLIELAFARHQDKARNETTL
ncbi:MAG TPA: D-alanine--D-alanine ligase family protein [Pyrinomonadaceae bacterium]|jgi:D-alanine-D-alanine ligase